MIRRTLGLVAAAALALSLTSAPGTAQATPSPEVYDQGHFDDTYSLEYDDCGFPIQLEGRNRGYFRTTVVPGSGGQAFLANEHYRYRETHTNAETGDSIVIWGVGHFQEHKAWRVKGDVWAFFATDTGTPFVVVDHGKVVLRDHGKIYLRTLFDTLGDGQPGGEVLAEKVLKIRGSFPSYRPDFDFCRMMDRLIG
jgi:hypothetical protein